MTLEEDEFLKILTALTKEFTAEQHAKLADLLGQANRWGRDAAFREVESAKDSDSG
jgi:lysyl-tRNA synthetase class I